MSNTVVKKVIYTDTRYGEYKELFDEILKKYQNGKIRIPV